MRREITQEYLAQCFYYNPISGVLRWRKDRPLNHFASNQAHKAWHTKYAGEVTGSPRGMSNYLNVGFNESTYMVHRLIWMLEFGDWPHNIDHIDGDKQNNRLANIRTASPKENARNAALSSRSTTGITGVSKNKITGRYRAHIGIDGNRVMIGSYDTIAEAEAARGAANLMVGFHKNHGRICQPQKTRNEAG